ncbi:MAG: cellobiose phosphorylase [Roseburia sp.]
MEKNTELLNKALHLLPEVRKTKIVPPKGQSFFEPLGKDGMVEIDFGRHMVGYLHLKLGYINSHPDAPVWLKIYFAESKKELEEKVENYDGWICSGWVQQEQIHVDVIPAEIELPRRYAFRYVKIEVLDISSKFELTIDDAYVEAVSSADETTLIPYESTDKELVVIDRIACNTLHDCMQQVFEDGPKRDRRLWIGDLRLQALANYETYRMNDMVKGCLYLFAALPMENGQVGACVFMEPEPEVDDTCMFDYSLLFIPTLWDYYQETGDRQALEELWLTVKQQLKLAEERVDEDGIVADSDVLGWCFLDWSLELNKQAGAQGVLLYALKAAIRIAGELKEDREAEMMQKKYDLYCGAAKKYFWDEKQKLFVSGKDRQVSYASQVWLILGGAANQKEGINILHRVAQHQNAVRIVTPYMYHYYIEAFLQCGEKEEALQIMKTYWGGMAKQGADTFWELYDPKNPEASPYGGTIVNSYCHAWSCAPAYFLRRYYTGKLVNGR